MRSNLLCRSRTVVDDDDDDDDIRLPTTVTSQVGLFHIIGTKHTQLGIPGNIYRHHSKRSLTLPNPQWVLFDVHFDVHFNLSAPYVSNLNGSNRPIQHRLFKSISTFSASDQCGRVEWLTIQDEYNQNRWCWDMTEEIKRELNEKKKSDIKDEGPAVVDIVPLDAIKK